MALEFGQKVKEEAVWLAETGKDPNQTAKVLCDQDPDGHNYGIGIILDGKGNPMPGSPTLLEYAAAELDNSTKGSYMNSAKIMADVKAAVLKWQRIPGQYGDAFKLALPSDAGTGAVKTSIEVALALNPQLEALGIEELGWPAYKAIAKSARISWKEFPQDAVAEGDALLPVYQAGPLNTTGMVRKEDVIQARARAAAKTNTIVILDRAYPGFEFARDIKTTSYDDVMRKSFELQIKPFIDEGVPFCLALSPTKAFVTFALRPCGMMLVYCPGDAMAKEVSPLLTATIRARGSAFEHPVSRGFTKAMVNDLSRLEDEHKVSLGRLADAETLWKKLTEGTPIEYLFSGDYAGLFRNPEAKEDAAVHIYDKHIYPVLAKDRCRMNVSGIPVDEDLAKNQIAVFAEQCY